MRTTTQTAHTINRVRLALAALSASAAIGYASTIHAQPTMHPLPFMQRVEYTAPLSGSGPAPTVQSIVGDNDMTIGITWLRQDEGAAGAYLFSCNSPVETDNMGEACDLEREIVYDSFTAGDTASVGPSLTNGAQRSTWYLIETSSDGTWRSINHIALLRFDVSIPFVMSR